MGYSIVYMRPDGWWEAGSGWLTEAGAVLDGEAHNWGASPWAVVPTSKIVDIDGDRRLPPSEGP